MPQAPPAAPPAAGSTPGLLRLLSSNPTATGTETLTITLHMNHPGHGKPRIQLTFTPSHGRKQTLTTTIRG